MANHFLREAKLTFLIPGVIALVGILTTVVWPSAGGSLWNEEASKKELLAVNPGCSIVGWMNGEGDAEHVYVNVELACDNGRLSRKGELLFQWTNNRWRLSWEDLK